MTRKPTNAAAPTPEQQRSTMPSRLAFHSFLALFPLTNSSYRCLAAASAPLPRRAPAMAAATAPSPSWPLTPPPSPSSTHRLTSLTCPYLSSQVTAASRATPPPSITVNRATVSPVSHFRSTATGRRLEAFMARPDAGSMSIQLSVSELGVIGDGAEKPSWTSASTRNGEPRNHADEVSVSTTRDMMQTPPWCRSTAETRRDGRDPGTGAGAADATAAAASGNGNASAKNARYPSPPPPPPQPSTSRTDGHRARQRPRHVSWSTASSRKLEHAHPTAASDAPSSRRSTSARTSVGRSSITVPTPPPSPPPHAGARSSSIAATLFFPSVYVSVTCAATWRNL
uniref:Uncharacterized protein n=1 Tax=Oryza glumipatula TaxID=40148 RepID=A0A0E0BFH4_9ORYZ